MKAIIDTGKFSGKFPFVALTITNEGLESLLLRDDELQEDLKTGYALAVDITPEQHQYITKFDADIEVLYNEFDNSFFI